MAAVPRRAWQKVKRKAGTEKDSPNGEGSAPEGARAHPCPSRRPLAKKQMELSDGFLPIEKPTNRYSVVKVGSTNTKPVYLPSRPGAGGAAFTGPVHADPVPTWAPAPAALGREGGI